MWAPALVALTAGLVWSLWRQSRRPLLEYFFFLGTRWYTTFWFRLRSNVKPPFPPGGPGLLVSNHTCSADPASLLAGTRRIISFLVAREHFYMSRLIQGLLEWMHCVPVSRTGRDAVAARRALRRLQEGRLVGIFPEGNLRGVSTNRMRPCRAGVALLALRSRLPVYPVYIAGGPRTHKLVQSWLRISRSAVRLYFGKPVDLSAYYGQPLNRKLLDDVTAYIMSHVAALREQSLRKPSSFSRRSQR
jgi:1-acyl-sn-glycerol-3-phosphate acyltransferase